MKRKLFVASVAGVIASLPLLAKAEDRTRGGEAATNTGSPGWPKPTWCCASAVVWLDIPNGVYYREGEPQYGRTERGAFTCEKLAVQSGNRAS